MPRLALARAVHADHDGLTNELDDSEPALWARETITHDGQTAGAEASRMTDALGSIGSNVQVEPLRRTGCEEVGMPKGIEKPKDPQRKKRQRTIKQRRQDRRAARASGSS